MSDAHLVAQRVAATLGIREQARRPPTESLAAFLRDHKYLIVLDNCEHVRAACTALVDYLLRECPLLTVIATTREILAVAGEDVYWTPPLQQPDPTAHQSAKELAETDAVSLFVDRAGRAFTLTPQNAADVARLCRELEGIPLAIELAAAQLTSLSVKQLLVHMDQRLALLVGGRGGTAERQWKTVREAIRFSYETLGATQQGLFRRLAVFRGGWTWDAATAVCGSGAVGHFAIRERLDDLRAKSLLAIDEGREEKRFRMLDSLRQFAWEQLEAQGERRGIEEKHAAWFLSLAERAAPELLKEEQARWLDLLTEDADNFRAAVRWSIDTGNVETALRLTISLWRLTEIRGYWREGRERLETVLGIARVDAYAALRGKALAGLGMLAYRQGDLEAAKTRFTESLALARAQDDKRDVANALNDLGNVAQMEGDFDTAYQFYAESLSLERETGNSRGVAVSLFNAGNGARRLGRLSDAKNLLEQSRDQFQRARNLREAAFPLNALALVAIANSQWSEAAAYANRSLVIRRDLSDRKGIGDCLRTIGMVELGQRHLREALQYFSESLELARSVEDKRAVAETLEQFASAAMLVRALPIAVSLYAAAERIRAETHVRLAPAERVEPDANLARARRELGDVEFNVRQSAGRAMPFDEVSQSVASLAADAAVWSTEPT